MSLFTIYHSNALEHAVLGGGSWQANLPLSNLFSPTTTKRARSTNTQLASTQFTVKLAEATRLTGIQVIATNLSAAALYKISWYSDATFSTLEGSTGFIPVGSSIDWTNTAQWLDWSSPNFWLGAQAIDDPDNQGLDIRHAFANPIFMQFIKFEFDDTTNADMFVELGHVYLGDSFVPTYNVGPAPVFQRVTLTSMQEAIGGAQFFNRRGSRKRLTVSWDVLPREEVLGELDEIIRIHDIDRPVYVDLDPASLTWGRKASFLARIQVLPEMKFVDAYLESDTAAAVAFEFIQVL